MKLIKHISLIFLAFTFLLLGFDSRIPSNYNYKCANQMTRKEISAITSYRFKNYSRTDLDKLEEIISLVITSAGDTTEFEVFYHEKTDSSITLDVFGIMDERLIDNITCKLFNDSKLNLPKQLRILFHEYLDSNGDEGVMIGLKR